MFLIQRNSDEKQFVLKFIESGAVDINIIEKEIKVMEVGKQDPHGTILQCWDTFDFQRRIWIVLDLMDHSILTQLIEEKYDKYNENFIKYVMLRIVQGIAFLHSRNIIHRDLKSDNILLSSTGEIKLTGFQYAAFLDHSE